MRIKDLLVWSLATTLLVVEAASSEQGEGDFELRQLTEDNFRKETSRGIW